MKTRVIAAGLTAVVVLGIIAGVTSRQRHHVTNSPKAMTKQEEAAPRLSDIAVEAPASSPANSVQAAEKNSPATEPAVTQKESSTQQNALANNSQAQSPSPGSKRGKPPILDPDAREALALVGTNPQAEAYWYNAINDPSLPAEERKDLIEDLNEDGLSDPKHPGPEDLAVILSRIQILEDLEPMDQTNADAMQEAYKDLVNLAKLAAGAGGKPVN